MNKDINTWIITIACSIVVFVLLFSARNLFTNSFSGNSITAKAVSNKVVSGSLQNVKLSLIDNKYAMQPNTLKKGTAARIQVDAGTLSGCMQNIVIADFGIRKYITNTDNIIEFTPDKIGTFVISCPMGMGAGLFSVTDDGSAPTGAAAQVKPAVHSGGSCGSSGRGCGCGG